MLKGPRVSSGHQATPTPVDLYAFGNRVGPRPPRQGIDFFPDAAGWIGPESPPFPSGASLFGDPQQAPLTGHYHRLLKGTLIPPFVNIVADGLDVYANSPHPATHFTMFPYQRLLAGQFVTAYLALPWHYAGRKT